MAPASVQLRSSTAQMALTTLLCSRSAELHARWKLKIRATQAGRGYGQILQRHRILRCLVLFRRVQPYQPRGFARCASVKFGLAFKWLAWSGLVRGFAAGAGVRLEIPWTPFDRTLRAGLQVAIVSVSGVHWRRSD